MGRAGIQIRIRITALLFPAFLLVAGCKSERQSRNNIFYVNYSSGQLESIDPAFAKALYMMWTTRMVYNTLVEADENLHVVPSLAKGWQVSPDGLTYTFYLRNDVYFHDATQFADGKGRRMVASDVVYSFNRRRGIQRAGHQK